jgi:flagellar protein FliO/FliZ
MENYIFWTFILAILAVLCAGAAVFVRAYLTGTPPSALLFRPKGERRLEVVDHASIDSRRKLILIRRDDVEHLLLTGGPVDVVIETGISGAASRPAVIAPNDPAAPVRRTPVFGRDPDPAAPPLAGTPKL